MMRFLDFLFPPRVDEIALRDVPIDEFLALVAPKLVPETRPGTIALFPFNAPRVRSSVHEAKYHGSAHAFEFLASGLAEYLRDADDARNPVIVPIPLGKGRRKERGFNQIEEVACRALHSLDDSFILDTGLLERVKETQTQVSLERRRREENMHGAFRAVHAVDPARTYIIIDDVLTTGATLQAAIDALRDAGAEHIIPLALAH